MTSLKRDYYEYEYARAMLLCDGNVVHEAQLRIDMRNDCVQIPRGEYLSELMYNVKCSDEYTRAKNSKFCPALCSFSDYKDLSERDKNNDKHRFV